MGNRKSSFPTSAEKPAMSSPSVGALALAASTVREVYAPPEVRGQLSRAVRDCDIELARSISEQQHLGPLQLLREGIRKDNVRFLSLFEVEQTSPKRSRKTNLLEMGAQTSSALTVKRSSPDEQGLRSPPLPPLHLASWEGCPLVLAALLDRGADPGAKEQEAGGTALHVCVRSTKEEASTLECLKVLIRYNANVDAKDTNGETAIIIAAREGKAEHVKELLASKAHIDDVSKEGMATIELIANRIPSAREEFTKRLDSGISFDRNGVARLDFRKVFRNLSKGEGNGNMDFFFGLINSPFKTMLEHPLLWAFLNMKLVQVKKFHYFTIFCHLLFSAGLSAYCGIIFNQLCPGEDIVETMAGLNATKEDGGSRWDIRSTIDCNIEEVTRTTSAVVISSWIFLLASLIIYTLREVVKVTTDTQAFYKSGTYRNFGIILFSALTVSCGNMMFGRSHYALPRWTYYSASIACFTTWWEMMYMVGKIPRFGKYVHMFRSVFMEISRFMVAYIFLIIGFMMSFSILFADQEQFQSFPAMFVKVLVMMTGELEYDNLKYPQQERIQGSLITGSRQLNQFPLLAHPLVLTFVIMVNIVMMSLLVALAIKDMDALAKTAQRRELTDQILLISHVQKSFSSKLFQKLPGPVKRLLEKFILNAKGKFVMCPEINCHDKDYSVHSSLFKHALRDFHQKQKVKFQRAESTVDVTILRSEISFIREELSDLKALLKGPDVQVLRSEICNIKDELAELKALIRKLGPRNY